MPNNHMPFGYPLIDEHERGAVDEVLRGPILVHGPVARAFEADFAKFTGAPHAVSVSSCTAGMHLVYLALGLGPGDEVIVPAQTHVATAHAVELTGARPVFVDGETATGNIAIDAIEGAITSNTRAIAVVHYLGVPVDMPRVVEIADRHALFLLEDCALSPGASVDGVHTGLHGDVGVFSFYPVKHVTTGEGGVIILRDGELAAELQLLKAFGVDRTHSERKIPGVYDAVALGLNYRMSEIHAAIGVEQMKKLPSFLRRRRENYAALSHALEGVRGIRLLEEPPERLISSRYCLSVLLEDGLAEQRPAIMDGLTERGIGTSVYYPQPVPRMSYYREKYGYDEARFPVASHLSDASIALPVGPHLDPRQMNIIADNLNDTIVKVVK